MSEPTLAVEDQNTCAGCRYFDVTEPSPIGLCLRHAPVADPRTDGGALWPRVGADDWCGDWTPSEAVLGEWADELIRRDRADKAKARSARSPAP